MNAAERACNALEKDMMQRIATEYDEAALRSIRNLDAFFADMEALDHKKPPSVYRTQAQQERWRQREMRKLLEKHKAESVVSRQLEEAGDAIAILIVLYKIGLFSETGNGTAREINRQQKSFPAMERIQIPAPFPGAALPDLVHAKTSHHFTQQEREIEIILMDTQTPFSKVSIKNLKAAPALRRRLRNEMTQAVLKGESQQQLAKRIERVMQSGAYNARRIAQTERTRVQSQAAWDVMAQSEQLGVNMAKKWHAKMVNTRDSHAALNGAIAPLHEPFHTIWGNSLMYPGDPSAPANEVINCHCGISPVVLRPGEKIQPTPAPSGKVANAGKNGIIKAEEGMPMDISVEVDALTPCLRRVSDEKVVDTEVSQIHPRKGQFQDWEFDWSIPEKDGFSVYALKVKGEKPVQGLLASKVKMVTLMLHLLKHLRRTALTIRITVVQRNMKGLVLTCSQPHANKALILGMMVM